MIPALSVQVAAVTQKAEAVRQFELLPNDDQVLPAFTAGAHIDIHLPIGITRSYSLVNPQEERGRYVIAVAHAADSRGGSRYLYEEVKRGDILKVGSPRNNFQLDEGAHHSVLIAGGIGATPIVCMIQRLEALKRSWRLHYFARSREAAAFVDFLSPFADKVAVNFDNETGSALPDVAGLVGSASDGSHFYCCGPAGMLKAFEAATDSLPRDRVHVEYFEARDTPATDGSFIVELARSGRTITIPCGRTILQTLQDAHLDVPHSCQQGVCGACETRVLSGIPDHRDGILTDGERAAGQTMMICCSGAKTERLVLDL